MGDIHWKDCCHRYWRGQSCLRRQCRHQHHLDPATHDKHGDYLFPRNHAASSGSSAPQQATPVDLKGNHATSSGSSVPQQQQETLVDLPRVPGWLKRECQMLEIDLLRIYDRSKTETWESRDGHHDYVWALLFSRMSGRVDTKAKVMEACCYSRLYHGLPIADTEGKWDIKELRRKYGSDPSRHVLS